MIRFSLGLVFLMHAVLGYCEVEKPSLKTMAAMALFGVEEGELREVKKLAGVKVGDTSTTVLKHGQPDLEGWNDDYDLYMQGWFGLNHSTYLDAKTAVIWDSMGTIKSIVVGVTTEALAGREAPVDPEEIEIAIAEPEGERWMESADYIFAQEKYGTPTFRGPVSGDLELVELKYPTANYAFWHTAELLTVFTAGGVKIFSEPAPLDDFWIYCNSFKRKFPKFDSLKDYGKLERIGAEGPRRLY